MLSAQDKTNIEKNFFIWFFTKMKFSETSYKVKVMLTVHTRCYIMWQTQCSFSDIHSLTSIPQI